MAIWNGSRSDGQSGNQKKGRTYHWIPSRRPDDDNYVLPAF
jgi:hypothetical protein